VVVTVPTLYVAIGTLVYLISYGLFIFSQCIVCIESIELHGEFTHFFGFCLFFLMILHFPVPFRLRMIIKHILLFFFRCLFATPIACLVRRIYLKNYSHSFI
jgi:hypothetical protein